MCGRYSIVLTEEMLQLQFGDALQLPSELPENYNVAPTQRGLVLTNRDPDRLQLFKWGLVPFWAKDTKGGARLINARSESIAEKPSFRKPIREKRCLVIADSFYEWKRSGSTKQPFRILPADDRLLIMAGIWERWKPKDDPEADYLYSYSIITGPPNADVTGLHDRMPMLLQESEQQSTWLSKDADLDTILALLTPPPDGTLRSYPVSTEVNNVRNNGPQLHDAML